MPIVLAIGAALGWGASDYFGGASRGRTPVFVVLTITQWLAVLALVPVLIVHGVPLPENPRILYACGAGLAATLELRIVYLAISRGDAFITAPVGALGATLAVIVGVVAGENLTPALAAGLTCAVVGGGLSASAPRHRPRGDSALRDAPLCLGAAVGVGCALSCLHAAGRIDPYWAATLLSASTALPATVAVVAGRRGPLPCRAQLPGLAIMAAGGTLGDLAYAAASRGGGALAVVSAISSLYPLATIALGAVLRGQRTRTLQATGIALALLGAVLLGAAAP